MGILQWLHGLTSNLVTDTSLASSESVSNPANGLPMVGGMAGVDIKGNPYGINSVDDFNHQTDAMDVNPANGLPMVGGVGGIDIEGNPYGTDFDVLNDTALSSFDDNSSFDSSFDTSFNSSWDD